MTPIPTLANLDKRLELLHNDHKHLAEDVDEKHQQNRNSIHTMANNMQSLTDSVVNLRIQIARWSVGAGILTAIAGKLIEHYWK